VNALLFCAGKQQQEGGVTSVALRKILAIAIGFAGLALGAPASAQLYSDGYKFLQAVEDRHGDDATAMLNTPGSTVINARDLSSGETGLHITIKRRDVIWTRWLLQEDANPNIADKNGLTPLMLASQMNFIEGVEALIAGGARVDVTNNTGETPLINAVHTRNFELMEVLLKAGASPDRTDNSGRSARDYARERGAGSRVLEVIEQFEQDEAEGAGGGRIYGPSF